MTTFVDDITATGMLHAEYRGIEFIVAPVTPGSNVDVDPQLLASAVMNLLHNAFKHTPAGGTVWLRASTDGGRLLLQVEDQCGGIPENKTDLFRSFGDRRGSDRTGLGLGLWITRQAARAHNGDVTVQNMPGRGCIFSISLPLTADVADLLPSA